MPYKTPSNADRIFYFPALELITFIMSLIVPISAYLSGVHLFWVSVMVLFFYFTCFFHAYYITISVDQIRLVPLNFFIRTKYIRREQIIKVVSVEDFTVENSFPIGSKKYKLLYRSDRDKATTVKFSVQNRKKEKAIIKRLVDMSKANS